MKTLFSLLILLFSKALLKDVYTQQWEALGPIGFTDSEASNFDLKLDRDQQLYLVFRDTRYSYQQATLMKFNGESWDIIGQRGFSEGTVNMPKLAFDGSNTPYVAFTDFYNDLNYPKRTSVMKYNGTDWEYVGSRGFTSHNAVYISIVIDVNNIPYIAFGDASTPGRRSVMKFNGTSWEYVGKPGFSESTAINGNMVIDSKRTLYVTYSELKDDEFKPCVMKFNGNQWEYVGPPRFSDWEAGSVSIALDDNDIPYVAYTDRAFQGKVTVMKFDGSNWIPVGNKGCTPAAVNFLSFTIKNNKPYLAFQDLHIACRDTFRFHEGEGDFGRGYTHKASAMVFENGEWNYLGEPCFSANEVMYPNITVADNGTAFIGYADISSTPYRFFATVMKLGDMSPLEVQPVKKNESLFNVYPNPVKNSFTIIYQSKETDIINLKVKSLSGAVIYYTTEQSFFGTFGKEIDIGQNPPGLYFVELTTGKERLVRKVVINK